MIFQDDTLVLIIGLIVGTLILFLALYVAEMYIISKTTAKDKKLATVVAAFLGIFLVPIIAGAIGMLFGLIGNAIGQLQGPLGISPHNYLMSLVPVFAYLLFWAICKFLLSTTWEKSGWVALIGLIILYLIWTIFPMIPQTLPYATVI